MELDDIPMLSSTSIDLMVFVHVLRLNTEVHLEDNLVLLLTARGISVLMVTLITEHQCAALPKLFAPRASLALQF
jgi:hypothetical protein